MQLCDERALAPQVRPGLAFGLLRRKRDERLARIGGDVEPVRIAVYAQHAHGLGLVVGRIMKAIAAPEGTPWLRAGAHRFIENRRPTHGHESTPETAMAEFAKSWRREAKMKNPACEAVKREAEDWGR